MSSFKIGILSLVVLGSFLVEVRLIKAEDLEPNVDHRQAIIEQINRLTREISELTLQINALQQAETASETVSLVSQLVLGSAGAEVRRVQQILATDPTVYPEGLVTGYFGPLTEKAVRKFQQKHGLQSVGEVGPQTRYLLLSTSTGTLSASTSTPSVDQIVLCHVPPENPTGAYTIKVALQAAPAHLDHGDTVGVCANGR